MKIFLIYLGIINLIGLTTMYYDKRCAIKGKWRVPEMRLFEIAAILGSPGILAGMFLFHHKTKHPKFTLGIPAILAIQIYLLIHYKIIRLN